MFNSATIFRISPDFKLPPLGDLETAAAMFQFWPCGPTQAESFGWIPPRGKKSTVLVEAVGAGVIMRLSTERRAVPAAALNAAVLERVERYKQETGRERVSSSLRKEFKEDENLTLLPRAFPTRSATSIWIDPLNHFLVVDSGSLSGSDRIVGALVEMLACVPGANKILVKPVQTVMSPGAAMAHWLASREAPFAFSVDRDCELKMPDDQKSAVRYSRHTLEIDEVAEHIASGKVPTRLAMTWDDRVSLVLNDMGQIGKIKLLDIVLDDKAEPGKDDDGFDTDAAIITGELVQLIPDLLDALGGELIVATSE